MTVISFAERSGASRPFVGRWFGVPLLLKVVENFIERRRRQRAIAELEALDDRYLRDIGVARCEIWYRVNHPQEF